MFRGSIAAAKLIEPIIRKVWFNTPPQILRRKLAPLRAGMLI
jgi:hypothetical protein